MGIFGSNYENAGSGIAKNAPKKKGILRFFELYFRKFWKIIEVNMLYSLFFIPVLIGIYAFLNVSNPAILISLELICAASFVMTIGPATAAMFKILRNYTLEKHAFIFSDFKECFTKNFKKSCVIGIIDVVMTVSILSGMKVYPQLMSLYGKALVIPFIISISVAIVVSMMSFYAYLMVVAADLSFKNVVKNSFVLSCVALKKNLLTLVISFIMAAVPAFLILRVNMSFMFLLPLAPASIIGFVVCFNTYPVIQKYVINPYYEQKGEVNPELESYSSEDDEVLFEDRGGKEAPIKKSKKAEKKYKPNGKTIS